MLSFVPFRISANNPAVDGGGGGDDVEAPTSGDGFFHDADAVEFDFICPLVDFVIVMGFSARSGLLDVITNPPRFFLSLLEPLRSIRTLLLLAEMVPDDTLVVTVAKVEVFVFIFATVDPNCDFTQLPLLLPLPPLPPPLVRAKVSLFC